LSIIDTPFAGSRREFTTVPSGGNQAMFKPNAGVLFKMLGLAKNDAAL
jgi:hypothetical protein